MGIGIQRTVERGWINGYFVEQCGKLHLDGRSK